MKHTKSAGGVVARNNLILVVSQKGTSWSLPKGHIDRESKIQAAKREIYEESGITSLELIKEFASYQRYKIGDDGREDKTELKTIYMFLFHTNQGPLKPVDPENPEAKWVPKENVADLLTHPKDKEFFLSIINKM